MDVGKPPVGVPGAWATKVSLAHTQNLRGKKRPNDQSPCTHGELMRSQLVSTATRRVRNPEQHMTVQEITTQQSFLVLPNAAFPSDPAQATSTES